MKAISLIPAIVMCVICSRKVRADAEPSTNQVYRNVRLVPVPGQKCPRCSASLDSAFAIEGAKS